MREQKLWLFWRSAKIKILSKRFLVRDNASECHYRNFEDPHKVSIAIVYIFSRF